MTHRIGIIGARGYTGNELLRLVGNHDEMELAFVSSRKLAGERVSEHADVSTGIEYEALRPEDLADRDFDALVLALPNGLAPDWAAAIDTDAVVLDLSSDHRFDDTGEWVYGATEWNRDALRTARLISNPGCYATGMQAVLRPMVDYLEGPPHVFGVSGYSGAGTKPSPKNDVDKLHHNLMPYGLVGHTHEREVSRHIGHSIRFNPHVAEWFRGIALTISMELHRPLDLETVRAMYESAFEGERLLHLVDEAPLVKAIANRHHVEVGGLTLSEDGMRLVAVATIDNLLKGAATQALQNINLALGLPELSGIEPEL